MKSLKIFLLLIIIIFTNNVDAQTNCQNAIYDYSGFTQIPISPVGSIAPTGPDYGCVTMLSRPTWGYFRSCDSTSTNFKLLLDQQNNFDSVYISVVIWGPFHNKSDACNNLTSSNIVTCVDSVLYNDSPAIPFTGFLSGPGEFYYYMITTSDTISNNSYNSFHAILQNQGVVNNYECFECNDQVTWHRYHSICLVTYDSTSQKTKIVWEKTPDNGVDGYILHRGVQGSPFIDSITYISNSIPGEYIDIDSHPLQYAEFFRIQPVDSCGNKYSVYQYLPVFSAFLQTTPGFNNIVNLNWNNTVYPQDYNFEQVVYIHRGASPQTMAIIDTIPIGISSYSDINAPAGQLYYALERRRLSPCNPNKLASGSSLTSGFSNISGVVATGINKPVSEEIFTYPNPVTTELHIQLPKIMLFSKLAMYNEIGQLVKVGFVNDTSCSIDVSNLETGSYLLCIEGSTRFVSKFIVKSNY